MLTIKKCSELDSDCLIGSGSRGVLYSTLTAFLLRIPYVAVGHGDEFNAFSGIYGRLLKTAFNRAKKVICVSNFTKNMANNFGVHNHKVKVIYNGADAGTYKPGIDTSNLRKSLKLEEKKIILTVGNVSERKAQDVVIRAMPKVLESCPDAHYLVVGLPTLRSKYEALAEELKITEQVYFTGTVPKGDLCQYYNLCDIFVLNSRVTDQGQNEGFGIVLVEAGLCGKPVIGTRGCGIEEVITEGQTGLLVDQDSPLQTADAIITLLQDKDMAIEMGERGRQKALANFTWERCAHEFHETIKSCVQ
jgi:phosphatidylinositol alpha-1,6-mannosyltransferase